MKPITFLIVTHVKHAVHDGRIYAFGPYVWEMNLWLRYVDRVIIACPLKDGMPDPIDLPYERSDLQILACPYFDITTIPNVIRSFFTVPVCAFQVLRGMLASNHLHIRSAGNMAFIAMFLQFLFPQKRKTVKFAGNWDPGYKNEFTVRIQQKVFANPRLSKNTTVLVYGNWQNQTSNILPFFTATYHENMKSILPGRIFKDDIIRCLFVATLAPLKRPLQSVMIAHELIKIGYSLVMDMFGEGPERRRIEEYISENGLGDFIRLHGSVSREVLVEHYCKAHFLIHPTVSSEGWPKAIAEAMFWGCIPVARHITVVPEMLGNGGRGLLFPDDADVSSRMTDLWNDKAAMEKMSNEAMTWSRQYTLEKFESGIKNILNDSLNNTNMR